MPEVVVHQRDLPGEVVHNSRLAGRVACDIETSGLDWNVAKIGTFQLFVPQDRSVHVVVNDESVPSNIISLLGDRGVTKIFHHAVFDVRFMIRWWRVDPCNVYCTKIASKVLSPRADSHSLKDLTVRWLGIQLDKSLQTSDWTAGRLSDEQVKYAVADVLHLPELMERLEKELRFVGHWALAEQCFEFIATRAVLDLIGSGDVFRY